MSDQVELDLFCDWFEGKFDNSGHNQGMKYNAEQRMKTVGY